jgi:hypothetical protein
MFREKMSHTTQSIEISKATSVRAVFVNFANSLASTSSQGTQYYFQASKK